MSATSRKSDLLRRAVLVALLAVLAAGCRSHSTAPSSATPVGAIISSTATSAHLTWATTGFSWPGLPDMVAQAKGFYAALKSGAVDAALLVDPFDAEAEQSGDPKYANANNYGYMTAAVNKDWAKDHPDELARFIRADLEAIKWMYNPSNKDALFAVVGPKLNIDQATFDRLYQRDIVTTPFWSTTGEITDAGVQGVLNSLVELGSLKQPTPPPGKYYDLTYLKLAVAGMGH